MTKFEGEAKDVRGGRPRFFPTGKELRKNMEIYKRTGVHPDLRGASGSLPALPERDQNRPHVFMDVQQGKESLGRMVLEVFEDEAPLAARQLLNRFREGTRETVQNTHVHRLITDMGIFFGTSQGYKGSGVQVKRYGRLHHNLAGVVSLSTDGLEVAITTSKAISLDKEYQVVARVHKGLEMLQKLNDVPVDKDDAPRQRISITACGISDAEGTYESLEEAARREAMRKETPEQAAVRLQAESKQVRSAVRDALESGLKRKAAAEPEAAAGAGRPKKVGMLSDVLGDLSDDSEEEEEA